jgi:tRNA pseudouridine38-40 synthase
MDTPLKGIVAYDGTGFCGWQRQHEHRTVQGEIETALSRIANRPVAIQGAGRTDSGVHALGQVFSCVWPGEPPARLAHAVSKMLAPEIRIESIERVPPDFNARFSATSKRYRYTLELARNPHPLSARHAWQIPYEVDLALLESLLPRLVGTHDFAGFQSAGAQERKTTVRTLYSVTLHRGGLVTPLGYDKLHTIEFHGDGFLYKMVRNLTGSLIEIARGRFSAGFIEEALASSGPFTGHCAPPHGLALVQVFYGDEVGNSSLGTPLS